MDILGEEQRKPYWEWVDDGDGYNQRDEWDIKGLLEAQLKDTLRQIMEWGEEECPHPRSNKSMGIVHYRKECQWCWLHLKKQGGSND